MLIRKGISSSHPISAPIVSSASESWEMVVNGCVAWNVSFLKRNVSYTPLVRTLFPWAWAETVNFVVRYKWRILIRS